MKINSKKFEKLFIKIVLSIAGYLTYYFARLITNGRNVNRPIQNNKPMDHHQEISSTKSRQQFRAPSTRKKVFGSNRRHMFPTKKTGQLVKLYTEQRRFSSDSSDSEIRLLSEKKMRRQFLFWLVGKSLIFEGKMFVLISIHFYDLQYSNS